ncbi:hypothetical protein RD792_004930 [Penstemon davidsonii]|uniref:BHLH domain-containing protein n=1 Tax=Penstemon davidsonii TaxID=160366 RepID=A0ABR0DIT3_9LAMI|nr:hypothetical protein RD792_004930 [Penstemon davidsonii]
MYPSSTSSSSQGSIGNSSSGGGGGGLMRYGSAPSSLFTTALDSVIGATRDFSTLGPQTHLAQTRFFPSESSESTLMPNLNDTVPRTDNHNTTTQPSYGFPPAASNLVRHSSLPTGFLNQLASTSAADNGFSITRAIGNYDFNGIGDSSTSNGGPGPSSRLNSQHSFTRQLDRQSLPRISELETHDHHQNNAAANNNQDVIIRTGTDHINNNVQRNSAYNKNNNNNNNNMGPWDDSNSTVFSTVAPSKRSAKTTTFRNGNMESQFQFSMPEAALEMATMENLLYNNNNNIPQDSIPCKIRAKRGFATHPRSIAERERRTRISGKLKKLQDLVPNMDKQTSYSDMLDLAVQHIKTLQNQLQKLNKENDSCTCGCKKTSSPENT